MLIKKYADGKDFLKKKGLVIWLSDAYSKSGQTSKIKLFAKIVDNWKALSIFVKNSILDARHGSEYASDHYAESLIKTSYSSMLIII